MKFTVEQNKKLIEIYPYLLPRNVFSDQVPDDYDYSYIRGDELPDGWQRLFLLYCKKIRPLLIRSNYVEKFRFSQLKEKWGKLCLYNFGCNRDIHIITMLFENYSSHVCQICGNSSTHETQVWIGYFCNDCAKEFYDACKIKHSKHCKITSYQANRSETTYYTYKFLDKEYKKVRQMTDEEFWTYIIDTE